MPWHPLQNAIELPTGEWLIVAEEKPHAEIASVRQRNELGYRFADYATIADVPLVIAYHQTLRGAAESAHSWITSGRSPTGRPRAAWVAEGPSSPG